MNEPCVRVPEGATRSLLALALSAATVALGAVAAPSAGQQAGPPAAVVPGELVVGFDSAASKAEERDAVNGSGGRIDQRITSIDAAVVTVDPDKAAATTRRLAAEDAVDYVEPNYVLHAFRLPNDRPFGEQWGLRNTGQYGGTRGRRHPRARGLGRDHRRPGDGRGRRHRRRL